MHIGWHKRGTDKCLIIQNKNIIPIMGQTCQYPGIQTTAYFTVSKYIQQHNPKCNPRYKTKTNFIRVRVCTNYIKCLRYKRGNNHKNFIFEASTLHYFGFTRYMSKTHG